MRCPIYIQTKFGSDLYAVVFAQFIQFAKAGTLDAYREVLAKEKNLVSRELTKLLYDEKEKYTMEPDDPVGWNLYKELSDKYTILNYFETRKA